MRVAVIAAVMVCAVSGWGQSLGDLMRAEREKPKPHASRVITNDNLNDPTNAPAVEAKPEPPKEPTDPLQRELFHMRTILHNICADPRTENGQTLSAEDKAAMDEGVKPLRVRVAAFQKASKKLKDDLAALDQAFEAKILRVVNTPAPLTDADLQRVKSLREEHDAQRAALIEQAARDRESYKTLQEQLGPVVDECPAAAASVPD